MKKLWIAAGAAVLVLGAGAYFALGPGGGGGYGSQSAREARLDEARTLIAEFRYDKAAERLSAIVARDTANADAHYHLGEIAHKTQDYEAADRHLEAALQADPGHVPSLYLQGRLYALADRIPLAEANLARLREACPQPCPQVDYLAQVIRETEEGESFY